MERVKVNEERIQFLLKDRLLARPLREFILEQIPVMAIRRVDVTVNESLYRDPNLSNNLNFIPIRANPDDFCFTKDCSCEDGCEKCQVIFDLKIECPLGELRTITNFDLRKRNPSDKAEVVRHVVDGKERPLPMGKLSLIGNVEAVCYARLGLATDHCCFRPTTNVVCLPDDDGIKFKFNLKRKVDPEWLMERIRGKFAELILVPATS
jgi:DNA-directed RNA polymerase II subunit RPB3